MGRRGARQQGVVTMTRHLLLVLLGMVVVGAVGCSKPADPKEEAAKGAAASSEPAKLPEDR